MATTGRPTGRPPKPLEQHRALGNPSHKPLPPAPMPGEGLPATSSIPNPPELGDPGLDLWIQVWTAGQTWLSPRADAPIITLLCQAQDEAEEIRGKINSGEVERYYVLPNGSYVTHPLVVQLKDLRVQSTSWLASLGFSPSDRARLGIGEIRQADALDELQRRRQERKTGSEG